MEQAALKVVREVVEPCRVKLTIDVPVEETRRVFEKAFAEVRKHGKIDGFRPGKTPRNLILRHYGSTIREEARKELLREATKQAIEQEKVTAETAPRLEPAEPPAFVEDAPFAFAVSFDVTPVFALPAYQDMKLARTVAAVDTTTVEKAIQDWLLQRAKYEAVDRAAQEGDMLKVAWHGELSEPLADLPEHTKFLLDNPDGWLPMRKPDIIPGAVTAMVGLKAGEERTFAVNFPSDYMEKNLIGKSATFTIRIIEVQGPQAVALTDAIAQEMGHKDVADMKTSVQKYLTTEEDRRQDEALRGQVLQALLQVPDFPLPPATLSRETVDEFVRISNLELRRGRKEEDLKADQDKLFAQARTTAVQKLKRRYVLRAVADAEKIEVSSEEMMHMVSYLATSQKVAPKTLLRQMDESGRIGDLHDYIRETKTLALVLKRALGEDLAEALPADAPPTA